MRRTGNRSARPRILSAALMLGAALVLPAAAQAATTVTFVAPQTYRDGNLSWGPVQQRLTLDGLERIIKRLAGEHLPAGYELDIAVLDLDLAGKVDPLRARTGELRVMRQDTWPSMKLAYTLRKGGRVVCGGIHMSDIPQFPYSILWEERQVVSVANLTRADALEFLDIAPRADITATTTTYPLEQANEALADLRAGRFQGAAVLVP